MKWEKCDKPIIEVGQTRIRRGFLFWPKTIAKETRWLCFAKWCEEVQEWRPYDHPAYVFGMLARGWIPVCWVNGEQE